MWILYEYENGKLKLNPPSNRLLDPSKRKPIEEYIRLQGRFKHLTEKDIEELKRYIEQNWANIKIVLEAQEKQ